MESIQSEKYTPRDNSDLPAMDIPVIDLSLLGTSLISEDEFVKLRSALESWGCFQAINHGMTIEFLDDLREVAKQFFELPLEEKQKYSREANDFRGYRKMEGFLGNQEMLYLAVCPEYLRNYELWPEKPKAFRSILNEYSTKLNELIKVVFKAMARSLNLEENCFLEQYGERAKVSTKFGLCPQNTSPDDLVLGLKPHTDGSAITLVLQDREIEGLQFLKDNQWFRAPIVEEALLVNVGDQAEISSNGIFKSSIHRVVTNSKKERISLVSFVVPELDKGIEPFEKLIDESRPRLYKMIKNYPKIYIEYDKQGKRPIEAAKIF